MNAAENQHYRSRLEALRDQLNETRASIEESAQVVDLDEPIGRLSRMDALQQQKRAEQHKQRHRLRTRQVADALRRVDDETYGECIRCGDDIHQARLDAFPEVAVCLDCQNELEGH